MATKQVRKLLFSIYIDGNQERPVDLETLANDFRPNSIAEQNAVSSFGEQPRLVDQIGFYHDPINTKGVFTGVADAQDLIEVPEDGKPRRVPDSTGTSSNVQAFVDSVVKGLGLEGAKFTWVVVPLDELGGGFGTLYTEGMAGIQGGG